MKFFKKTDFIVIAAIIAVSITAWLIYRGLFSGQVAKAEIYFYSQHVETVELNAGTEKTFSIPQDENVILYLDGDGHIQFIESDCPDKVCIKTGKVHLVGQSAACLPNGIVVKIVPKAERRDDDPDMIIGGRN